jgi:ELMO domain-containing protein
MSQQQQSHQHVRRRRHAGPLDGDAKALRESLLASRSSDEDGIAADQAAAASASPTTLIVQPRPFSVVAFLSSVVQRWLSAVLALLGVRSGGPPPSAATPTPTPTTVAGARRVATSASSSSSSAEAALSTPILHLRARLAAPYLPDDPSHQAALLELWRLAFGPAGPPPPTGAGSSAAAAAPTAVPGSGAALRSPLWQEMGWQGLDPATDFRGAGRFGLENLLALGRERPELFRSLLKKERGQRSAWEYPFCVAGLNLTFGLAEVLVLGAGGGGGGGGAAGALGRRATPSPAARAFARMVAEQAAAAASQANGGGDGGQAGSAPDAASEAAERAFNEIYAAAFALLDAVWLERKAGYMEFGAAMADTKARLASALARCGGESEEGGGGGKGGGGAAARALAAVFGGTARRRQQQQQRPTAAAAASGPIITARDLARAAGVVDEEVLAML